MTVAVGVLWFGVAGCTAGTAVPTPTSAVSSATSTLVTGPATPDTPGTANTTPRTAPTPFGFPVGHDDLCQPLLQHRTVPNRLRPLPASSTATIVRWCVLSPGPAGFRAQLRQSTGNVSAVNVALHAPLTVTAPPGLACSAVAYGVLTIEVLDQHHRLFRPRLPTDACGTIGGTVDAIARTAYTVVTNPEVTSP